MILYRLKCIKVLFRIKCKIHGHRSDKGPSPRAGLQIARQQAGKLHRVWSEGSPTETAVNKAGHKP